jgi:nucleoside-diphosphate-sugar epimerase
MKILITGAAGFIGSHLAEHLASDNHEVTGIDNFSDYYNRELKSLNQSIISDKGVGFKTLDIVSDSLSEIMENSEIIYHLAAQPGISATTPFATYLSNNIQATQRLLAAAMKSTILKLFVNISTSSVYGADATGDEQTEPRPTSFYGVTKLAAEQLVMAANRDQNFPACSMRLFSVYGPRERPEKLYPKLIDSILNDKVFTLYEGSNNHIRSYTFINDIIDGLLAVLKNIDACNGEIINLGTDTTITTGEGISVVENLLGKSANIRMIARRPGDQEKTHANIMKARRLLRYNPHTPVEEGLAKEIEWYQNQIYKKIHLYPDQTC